MRIARMLLVTTLAIGMPTQNLAAEKITLDIQGNKEIIAKLGKLVSVKKDKFEKTLDFSKRLCEQTIKELGIDHNNTKILIGVAYRPYAPFARYNADKQAFRISIGFGGNYYRAGSRYDESFRWNISFDPNKYQGIRFAEDNRDNSGTYSAKNAFGASKEVKVRSESAAVLYFPKTGSNLIEIFYPSKSENARRIDGDLRLAILTRIQPPCFVAGKGRKSPTIDYPYEIFLSEVGIVVAPNPEWLLYLESTKEILKRGKLQ